MKHPLYDIFQMLVNKQALQDDIVEPLSEKYISNHHFFSGKHSEVGFLILAGGQGTRLGIGKQKGCINLPFKKQKSLFQLFMEQIKVKGRDLPLAIMTSLLNHEETVTFLQRHDYFGLTHVEVFQQDVVPVCDDRGEVIFDEGGQMVCSPDGNGKALMHLYRSGVWERWKRRGVKIVRVFPIDNPLTNPFDEGLLEEYQKSSVDLILQCIKREDVKEKVGVVGIRDGRLVVREYSELSSQMRSLFFAYGNSGNFSCTLDFVEHIFDVILPWHLARKKIKVRGEKCWVWKFETFIFDLFPYAQCFKVVVRERNHCFAPIKSFQELVNLKKTVKSFVNF